MGDPFAITLGVLAVVQTAAATAEKLYNFGQTVQGAKKEMLSLDEKANSLRVVLQCIVESFQDPKFQNYLADNPKVLKKFENLGPPLTECNKSMMRFLDLLHKNTEDSGSGARRFMQSVKWYYIRDDIIATRDELADTRDTCTFAFTGMNVLINIEARIEQAEKDAVSNQTMHSSRSPSRSRISEYQQQYSDFRQAARDGDNRLLKLLLDEGVPVDTLSDEGRTALSMASERGHVATVELLIQHKANVNAQSEKIEHGDYYKLAEGKRTPLHWAAVGGHTEVAKMLLEAGANIEARTVNRRTPALEAALHDHFQTIELLVYHGADLNASTYFGWTILHHACSNGQVELVELLLAHKANVEAVYSAPYRKRAEDDPTDQRPLHYATKTRNVPEEKKLRVMELLVDQGNATVSARDSNGATPIHGAVTMHWKAGLEVLLRRATVADLEVRDKYERNALDYADDLADSGIADMIRSIQVQG